MPGRVLIVGLGNPGSAYAANRHNIGFMAIDRIAEHHRIGPFRRRFQGETIAAPFAGHDAVFLKPMTYMNLSGGSVAAAARYYKIAVSDIVVFHDEIDLEAGRVRVKRGGGTAGHNGLRSIAAHVGADFRRVPLGVGRLTGRGEVVHHVLRDFAKADTAWLDPLLEAVARHAPLLLDGDDGAFMSKVAMAVRPPKRPSDERDDPPPAA
jgi:peptidyl-tRNA hydrolase, PTH1 family